MAMKHEDFGPMCNGSSLLSTGNITLCNTTMLVKRPPPPPPRRPPLPPCYTCATGCIFKAIELVYIFGVIANILVVTRVVVDKKLRKPTFVAIACLAISDALFVSCDLVLASELVINALTDCPPKRPRVQGFIIALISGICWFAANGHMALLAVVRFLLIVFPIEAHVSLTVKKVIISSVCVWILGAVILFTFLVVAATEDRINVLFTPKGMFVLWTVVYLIPFISTCILHLVKLRIIKNRAKTKGRQNVIEQVGKGTRKMTSLILLILLCAFIFPLPKFIHDTLVKFKYKFANREIFHNTSMLLFYLNNTLNPFIYALFSPQFRRSLQKMLRRKKGQQSGEISKQNVTENTAVTLLSRDIGSTLTEIQLQNRGAENGVVDSQSKTIEIDAVISTE